MKSKKTRAKYGGLTRNQDRKARYAKMREAERGHLKGTGKHVGKVKKPRSRLHPLVPCGNIACKKCYPGYHKEK